VGIKQDTEKSLQYKQSGSKATWHYGNMITVKLQNFLNFECQAIKTVVIPRGPITYGIIVTNSEIDLALP
jgi:hypothetical protein